MENNLVQEPAPKFNYYSPAEYLERERVSEDKHEYFDGHVYNMAGAGHLHNQISSNLVGNIFQHLKEKNCSVFSESMRVTNAEKDSYMYPDVLIVCGEKQWDDGQFDTLLNPSVIFEIISPSTVGVDKGRKLFYYKGIKSLKEYFIIETSLQKIHIVRKLPNGDWRFEEAALRNKSIFIETINFHLSLSDIYNRTGIE